MKRLKLLIFIFILALTLPLAYVVYRTHHSLAQEELAELRYFGEALFDRMERELELLVLREEQRPVDDYTAGFEAEPDGLDRESYILGYIQNNPDGTFLSPSVPKEDAPNDVLISRAALDELKTLNDLFNHKRSRKKGNANLSDHDALPDGPAPKNIPVKPEKFDPSIFSNRYYQAPQDKKQKVSLGREKKRVERITRDQALNVAQTELPPPSPSLQETLSTDREGGLEGGLSSEVRLRPDDLLMEAEESKPIESDTVTAADDRLPDDTKSFQVEVDPLQSVIIDAERIFIFRRIVIENQVYRQGFMVDVPNLLNHLSDAHFKNQPMARFTGLNLLVLDQGRIEAEVRAGRQSKQPGFSLVRNFPRPFSFLQARLNADRIPPSGGRRILNLMVLILVAVISIGLFAIYHSTRVVVDLSERRAGFVSSVTHELKTPLTNIRLYIEMLEHGIAVDPEREQEYFRILGSETSRLSRLINNVLEFSKLEKKQRRLDMKTGDLSEVLAEVEDVMREKLRQDGFSLEVHHQPCQCRYDREAMVQVLINLLENSIKFGGDAPDCRITLSVAPHKDKVMIRVSDTGPGIPRQALKKVFDDFYRVDNSLTRRTKGTGIGLALVKKLVAEMNGAVQAGSNQDKGCVITILLPKGMD